jgi:hypothetical protein
MRTRGEAPRGEAAAAAAAAQHAALLSAAAERYVAGELEAALAAVGPPGSPDALAALAHGDHALLRAACTLAQVMAIPPLLRAYGESPDALASMARALAANDIALSRFIFTGNAGAFSALLGAYRRAGRAHEALAVGDHSALRLSIGHPEIMRMLLAEYGEPGSYAVVAALAARDHGALRGACYDGRAQAAALLVTAYGPPGCAALQEALLENTFILRNGFIFRNRPVLAYLFELSLHCYCGRHGSACPTPDNLARFDATLAALLAALAEPDHASALRVLGAWLTGPKSPYLYETMEPAQRLALMPPDSLLARLAVATPAAWALNPDAAHALLSAPVRASAALSVLLALRRLPGGVAAPVAAHLRARPWLLFAGAAADFIATAAPPPPA